MCIPLGRNTVGSFSGRTHCVLVPSEKYVLWYRHLESTVISSKWIWNKSRFLCNVKHAKASFELFGMKAWNSVTKTRGFGKSIWLASFALRSLHLETLSLLFTLVIIKSLPTEIISNVIYSRKWRKGVESHCTSWQGSLVVRGTGPFAGPGHVTYPLLNLRPDTLWIPEMNCHPATFSHTNPLTISNI